MQNTRLANILHLRIRNEYFQGKITDLPSSGLQSVLIMVIHLMRPSVHISTVL